MEQQAIIEKFYSSFASGDVKGMLACYHDEVVFEDPAFGVLKGERAKWMWKMLLSRKEQSNLSVEFQLPENSSNRVQWIARYTYGKQKRAVTNNVSASFQFKDGKIIQHTDAFDLWKWTQQALGLSGYLLGWSQFMKRKIQQTTHKALNQYIQNQS